MEEYLFAGAYHDLGSSASERPKYGSLDMMQHPDGPSPRFGSSYFLLKPELSARSTFTFLGSQEPDALDHTGTLDFFEPVMATLLTRLERFPGILGPGELRIGAFIDHLVQRLRDPFQDPADRPLGRVLDYFVEAQVHGDVALARDTERLVADAAFQSHPVGELLVAMADKYGFALQWHSGFRLAIADVPLEFRGHPVRPLAERAARDGVVDAANLGQCANSLELDQAAWEGWAPYGEILTQLRRLWHVLVLGPHATSTPPPRR